MKMKEIGLRGGGGRVPGAPALGSVNRKALVSTGFFTFPVMGIFIWVDLSVVGIIHFSKNDCNGDVWVRCQSIIKHLVFGKAGIGFH